LSKEKQEKPPPVAGGCVWTHGHEGGGGGRIKKLKGTQKQPKQRRRGSSVISFCSKNPGGRASLRLRPGRSSPGGARKKKGKSRNHKRGKTHHGLRPQSKGERFDPNKVGRFTSKLCAKEGTQFNKREESEELPMPNQGVRTIGKRREQPESCTKTVRPSPVGTAKGGEPQTAFKQS